MAPILLIANSKNKGISLKPDITFQELARLQVEQLSKQPPLTLEQMRESVRKVQQGGWIKSKKSRPTMKPGMTFNERAKLAAELLSKQPPFTLEEMKAQAERVNADCLQSVKERIENAKTDPKTKIDELVKEQAEIAKVFQDVITTGTPVIRLSNDRWRIGTWYKIAQPGQHESMISLKHPFYFEWETYWGIGRLIIVLGEHVLGGDETLLIRFEKREEGIYDAILLAVSKKLSEMGYDSVVFYETEPVQLTEVYSISTGSDAVK